MSLLCHSASKLLFSLNNLTHAYMQLIKLCVDRGANDKTEGRMSRGVNGHDVHLTIRKLWLHLQSLAACLLHLAWQHSLWSKALDRNIHHPSLIYIRQLGCRYHHRPTLISHIGNVSG